MLGLSRTGRGGSRKGFQDRQKYISRTPVRAHMGGFHVFSHGVRREVMFVIGLVWQESSSMDITYFFIHHHIYTHPSISFIGTSYENHQHPDSYFRTLMNSCIPLTQFPNPSCCDVPDLCFSSACFAVFSCKASIVSPLC